jgi:hypothetical protein
VFLRLSSLFLSLEISCNIPPSFRTISCGFISNFLCKIETVDKCNRTNTLVIQFNVGIIFPNNSEKPMAGKHKRATQKSDKDAGPGRNKYLLIIKRIHRT